MDRPINKEEVKALAFQFETLNDAKKKLDAQVKDIKDKLYAACNEQDETEVDDMLIEFKVTETWSWDQDILQGIASPKITCKLSVTRDDFAEMSQSEQVSVLPALTVKRGRKTLKITHDKE